MKTSRFIALIAIAAISSAVSCNKETADPENLSQEVKKVPISFDAAGEPETEATAEMQIAEEWEARILDVLEDGNRLIKFEYDGIFEEVLDQLGEMPLPPYITHKLKDKNRYQTVYAEHDGSAAAPTAGLHFTKELLKELEDKGVKIVHVTLHVGLGTFRPVKVDNILDHNMHSEYYVVNEETANTINETKKNGGRIISVGTTSTRTLETVTDEDGVVHAGSGWTQIFIYPGVEFKCIDALITNFHLPESTLLMLVSALAGRENILNAYKVAVEKKYRFFSFGDAMFITDKMPD